MKLFTDDTSLFSIANGSNISASELNKDLQKISFNPDSKYAQEVIFSWKLNKSSHPKIFLIMHE